MTGWDRAKSRPMVGYGGAQFYDVGCPLSRFDDRARPASRSYAFAISIIVFFEVGSRISLAIALASSASFNHSAVRSFESTPA
jgi:hypothetical protein